MKFFSKILYLVFITGFCFSLTLGLFAEDTKSPVPTKETTTVEAKEVKAETDHHKGDTLPYWSVIPFVAILLSIAILPIASHVTAHWWENNNNKLIIALALGGISFGILIANHWGHTIFHTLVFEYVPFIILLGALFYISGGIVLKGDIEATPLNNSLFLLLGAFLASFIGTTGASMLLIRPVLKTNSERKHVVHTVVFFIFLVSNIGGSLTPLGDPPLFLGYLQGVPFTWTFSLFPEMILSIVVLLSIYFVWDTIQYKKELKTDIKKDKSNAEPISLNGQVNFIWLFGIVLSVAFINENYIPAIKQNPFLAFIREGVMILLILLSKVTSSPKLREYNKFTLNPIIEVAYLFIGIFLTMIPALILLEANGKSLGVTKPWQFFWAAGAFSSVLDNAPTYLTFLSLAKGLTGATGVTQILANPEWERLLKAISVGAVFMGANTYIGNAPNFMVKSVAEENKVNMPSFGGYILYSFGILIPLFVVITFIFFV
ncbi:MAG: sodium:proton antiporter [Leptospiraceae bacterium]|nr:sodium:proton antiporter [Leptospiraceae bacterium]MCK6381047.1 sodium:proton antiporter [Leptospiraceae bacterium]NUM40206.1 sodium:proton antiporter [Leptospiraceae bacterium]